jgi:hypothetical protein
MNKGNVNLLNGVSNSEKSSFERREKSRDGRRRTGQRKHQLEYVHMIAKNN